MQMLMRLFDVGIQADAKAQMVLRATSNTTVGAELDAWRNTSAVDTQTQNSNSEILLAPKLVEEEKTEEIKEGSAKVLSTIEQAVVLAKCLDVQRSNPDDELRSKKLPPTSYASALRNWFLCCRAPNGVILWMDY